MERNKLHLHLGARMRGLIRASLYLCLVLAIPLPPAIPAQQVATPLTEANHLNSSSQVASSPAEASALTAAEPETSAYHEGEYLSRAPFGRRDCCVS